LDVTRLDRLMHDHLQHAGSGKIGLPDTWTRLRHVWKFIKYTVGRFDGVQIISSRKTTYV